jgi:hypothetical protein
MPDIDPIDAREQTVRIDKMLTEIHRNFAESDRRHQEMRHAPWQVRDYVPAFAGMTAGAALLAAGVALGATIVKLFG